MTKYSDNLTVADVEAVLREALTKINVGDGWAAQIARATLAQGGGE